MHFSRVYIYDDVHKKTDISFIRTINYLNNSICGLELRTKIIYVNLHTPVSSYTHSWGCEVRASDNRHSILIAIKSWLLVFIHIHYNQIMMALINDIYFCIKFEFIITHIIYISVLHYKIYVLRLHLAWHHLQQQTAISLLNNISFALNGKIVYKSCNKTIISFCYIKSYINWKYFFKPRTDTGPSSWSDTYTEW